ncbi:MAG: hypothetical protein KAX05_08840 [Bacteroidales bacterium]|nr:hypothetical protein [Bacteroidales bacterium]
MKIGIIGFGAAAIGFIEKTKYTKNQIHIFEKEKDIYSTSLSGIRADGKLFVSKEMGGDLNVSTDLQKKLVDYYVNYKKSKTIEYGRSFRNKEIYRKFYEKGFQPVASDFYHIGTDQLKELVSNIYEDFNSYKNIHFHFNSEITNIEIENDKIRLNSFGSYDHVVVAVGRSGYKLVNKIIEKYPELLVDNTKVDLGIRYELPNHIVEELNKEMYEFKVRYKSKTGYIVRTFCNNPSGYVITENYGDFYTVNGHSKLKGKSSYTNFAILVTIRLTQPFSDPIGYGSYIAKLTNLLAGKDKLILQTFSNFKQSKRTKNLYRVIPTLPEDKYILGDINLAYPRRIIESIIDFIENLDLVIPGIANPDNLVYAPEIKFYTTKIDNQKISNFNLIGDCSGATRSIIYATAHGYLIGEKFLLGK